ncbi:MAG: hypothetical protein ABSG03_25390 [Bryobacteraceae bacterium]|jgi:hypothetical protein
MHSANIAEWILALVTTRDRAASTVGDLTELAATRGVVWFWSGVLRTAASLLWRDVAEQPARVTGLACLGLAVYIGIDLVFAGLSGAAFFRAAMASGHPLHLDSIGWKLWFTAPVVVSSLLIGRMLAHWATRRELAACVVYAILASIYNLVPMLGDNGAFSALLCILIVPAGAAWGRARRLRAT